MLASGQSFAHAIAADATSVYWLNGSDGTVMRFDKQACQSGVCK